MSTKRLFFGIEVMAPWPERLPAGRGILEGQRHLTLAFLGEVAEERIAELDPPSPPLVGSSGWFDAPLFLPEGHPRVVSWHALWHSDQIANFQRALSQWLEEKGFALDKRPWLSHVTLCRAPFDLKAWREHFVQIPCLATHLHLYESLGNLHYQPLHSYPVRLPFEERAHTADLAFCIRGMTLEDLYHHAFTALAFLHPPLLAHHAQATPRSLEEIVILLNRALLHADIEGGIPLKAVSFHGRVEEKEGLLQWEMIIDV